MDFKNYQSQIKELIAARNLSDFNTLLDKILFGESKSDKFLIKMELARLATPCQRVIDLRDKVTDECQLFQQGNLKHYLTKETIHILNENIELYGLYTIGVFEAVYSHIAKRKEEQNNTQVVEEKAKTPDQCQLIQLSQKNKRTAPRMFFVSSIDIVLANNRIIKAQTSNISSTGIKIKLKEHIHLINQEVIKILFTALQVEYPDELPSNKICYQIVKQTFEDDTHYLYLLYADDNPQFVDFIKKFIKNNQHKYKIDVHYYYQLTQANALKHSYLDEMNLLPIYLNNHSASPFLFALKNKTNKKIIADWTCNELNQLPILFNELRFTKLLAQTAPSGITTLYCFRHQSNGKNYFISATEEELLAQGLKEIFINYGATKKSWRVYQLTMSPYQYEEQQPYDITERLPKQFPLVTHIASIEPLAQAPLFSINTFINKQDLNKINQFIHRETKVNKASIFNLCSSEQRKEERYLYNSELSLSIDNKHYAGELIDFSLSGLKIKLKQRNSIFPSSNVIINLLALQKISNKYPLSQLHYKVVRKEAHNILHLQINESKTFEICNHFFAVLIQSNPEHFKCIQLKREKQPIAKRLIEIAEESFINCIFFVGKTAGRPRIKIAAIDKANNSLQDLFSMYSDDSSELNCYPVVNHNLYERLLVQPLKKKEKKESLLKDAIIYIRADKNEENRWLIKSYLDADFQSEKEKITFITQAHKEARFYALNYRLSTLSPINLNIIKSELYNISRFAIHLTKKLEEQLHNISAMIEITDRTSALINALEKE